MISNYQILQLLIKDGGYYSLSGLCEFVENTLPDEDIEPARLQDLRNTMLRSPFVVAKWRSGGVNQKEIRVMSVDEKFQKYARTNSKSERSARNKTYLRNEPEQVMTAVRLGMMFDKLLSQARSRHGCTN